MAHGVRAVAAGGVRSAHATGNAGDSASGMCVVVPPLCCRCALTVVRCSLLSWASPEHLQARLSGFDAAHGCASAGGGATVRVRVRTVAADGSARALDAFAYCSPSAVPESAVPLPGPVDGDACRDGTPSVEADAVMPALHAAAKAGVVALLRRALSTCSDVNVPHKMHGWSPLHFAAAAGRADAVQLLLEAGADPRLQCGTYGFSALHAAAVGGSDRCVDVLIAAGADTAARTREGRTALELAESGAVRAALQRAAGAPSAAREAPTAAAVLTSVAGPSASAAAVTAALHDVSSVVVLRAGRGSMLDVAGGGRIHWHEFRCAAVDAMSAPLTAEDHAVWEIAEAASVSGVRCSVVTTDVDGALSRRALLMGVRVVEACGSVWTDRCVERLCGNSAPVAPESYAAAFSRDAAPALPRCRRCGGCMMCVLCRVPRGLLTTHVQA